MKLRTGNMFEAPASLVLVTTNAMVNRTGRLVMGRGAAQELVGLCPGIDRELGTTVARHREATMPSSAVIGHVYGVLMATVPVSLFGQLTEVGAFQVKYHWSDDADPYLISVSCQHLSVIARRYQTVSLNFPGIGNGRLKREDVLPLLSGLPDNVTVWERHVKPFNAV